MIEEFTQGTKNSNTKPLKVDRHFIKEKVEDGTIYIVYVPTSTQVDDVLNKRLWKPDFESD